MLAMKKVIILILLIIVSTNTFLGCSPKSESVLVRVVQNLQSLETIQYEAVYQHVDTRMGYNRNDTAICYFDFRSDDTLIGTKYHIDASYGENVFDGSMSYSYEHGENIIKYINSPTKYDVGNSPFMHESVSILRRLLPVFMGDSTITITQEADSTIGGEKYHYLSILIENGFLQIGGDIEKADGYSQKLYLLITQKDLMPFEYGEIFPGGVGHSKIMFREYNYSATRPDSLWSYDRLPPDYLRITMNNYLASRIAKSKLRKSEKAPDWTLPLMDGDSVSLSSHRSEIVLLDFWYLGCVACTKAIPDINEIYEKYRSRGLKVYSIEFLNADRTHLVKYKEKNGVEYPMLYNGKNVGKVYGIMAAPTFILIDKDGKIVYSEPGLKKGKLIEAIEAYI